MGEFHDPAGKAFLHSVKFADFDFCAELAVQHVNTRQRDVLAENGRARRTGDNSDLRAADVNAVTMTHRFI